MRQTLSLLLLVLGTSCSNLEAPPAGRSSGDHGPTTPAEPGPAAGPSTTPEAPRLIREATLSLEVDDCRRATDALRRIAEKARGNVSSSSERLEAALDRRSSTVVLRVPAARFDPVLDEIGETAGEVVSRSVTVTDVTEEYVDVTSRLRARRGLEERYHQLLAQAEGTTQALEVERALSDVIVEIEQIEGRRRVLEDRVELATVTVEVSERPSALDPLRRAFSFGLNAIVGLTAAGLVMAMGLSPFLLLLALALPLARSILRRRAARRGVGAAPQPGRLPPR